MSSLAMSGARMMQSGDRPQRSALTEDARDEARVADMRRRKEERRLRLLNARERTIGLDVEALEKQVAEKEARKKAEKDEEMRYAAEQARMERALKQYEAKQASSRRADTSKLKYSWKQQQVAAKMTPEYADLRDPAAVRKARPVRMGDRDTALGASSMQVFSGEDLKIAERRALQKVQMKEWCLQIYSERAEAFAMEKEADRQYAAYLRQVEDLRKRADEEFEAIARAEIAETAAANKRLEDERREAAAAAKAESERLSMHEVETALSRGVLVEDPADGVSAAAAHRKRPDHYRGMGAEEVAEYYKAMEEQRAARTRAKVEAKAEDIADAAEQAKFLRAAAQIEAHHAAQAKKEREEYQRQLATQRSEYLARVAKEKSGADEWFATDNFYSAFGTSDR